MSHRRCMEVLYPGDVVMIIRSYTSVPLWKITHGELSMAVGQYGRDLISVTMRDWDIGTIISLHNYDEKEEALILVGKAMGWTFTRWIMKA